MSAEYTGVGKLEINLVNSNEGLIVDANGRQVEIGLVNNGSSVVIRGESPTVVLKLINNNSRVVVGPDVHVVQIGHVYHESQVWVPREAHLSFDPTDNGQVFTYASSGVRDHFADPQANFGSLLTAIIKAGYTIVDRRQVARNRQDVPSSGDGFNAEAAIVAAALTGSPVAGLGAGILLGDDK